MKCLMERADGRKIKTPLPAVPRTGRGLPVQVRTERACRGLEGLCKERYRLRVATDYCGNLEGTFSGGNL